MSRMTVCTVKCFQSLFVQRFCCRRFNALMTFVQLMCMFSWFQTVCTSSCIYLLKYTSRQKLTPAAFSLITDWTADVSTSATFRTNSSCRRALKDKSGRLRPKLIFPDERFSEDLIFYLILLQAVKVPSFDRYRCVHRNSKAL